MDDLIVAWLRAQLDADERIARAAGDVWEYHEDGYVIFHPDPDDPEPFMYSVEVTERAEHIALHDPAAVLADIEAKRRILDAYDPERDKVQFPGWESPTCSDNCGPDVWHEVVRHLAAAYRDRPGYRPEWSPES